MPNRKHRRGGRTTPKGTRPPAKPSGREHDLPPLVADARACVAEASPFSLLEMASGLIEATSARPTDSWGRQPTTRPDGPALFESFAASGWPALEALALAVATIHSDEILAARLRRLTAPRAAAGSPAWLATMGRISITDTSVHDEVLGDGENLTISWRWPGGHQGTAIVYVDHNMGTIVKDAFLVPDGAASITAMFARLGEPGVSIRHIAPGETRARIAEAIDAGQRVVPPLETETWPLCRSMVEWLLGHLPDDGSGYVRPEWTEAMRARLLDDFIRSPFGRVRAFGAAAVRELADPFVWFACDYGPGDPLRWSSVAVEIVLADWYPRKVFAFAPAEMRGVPDVLAAFIQFAHHRTDIPSERTKETLAAVERWRPDFLTAIARPGRSPVGNAARVARIAAGFDPHEFDDECDAGFDPEFNVELGDDDPLFMARMTDDLEAAVIEMVGGRETYESLDAEPLSEVPFDWSDSPAEIRDAIQETLTIIDRWAIDLFDVEVVTIARTVLAAVARRDAGVFRRTRRKDILAAAVLAFVLVRVLQGLDLTGRPDLAWRVATQKELAKATGIPASTVSNRSRTVATVVDQSGIDWPSVLHSSQRRQALDVKHAIADWRRDHPAD